MNQHVSLMLSIKKLLLLLLFLSTIFAQDVISTTVSGDGINQDQAVQSALRNAVEQAYGAFLSSNTKFLNDELIQDEITSVAQGNILSYDILSVSQTKSGVKAFLSAQVSLTKLAQFGQSKGQSISVNSNVAYMNIKKEKFYEENEYKIVQDYIASFQNVQLFDYTLQVASPKECSDTLGGSYQQLSYYRHVETYLDWHNARSWFIEDPVVVGSKICRTIGGKSNDWIYQIDINISTNDNFSKFNSGLIKLLKNLSIDKNTSVLRKKFALGVYKIEIPSGRRQSTIYVRNINTFEYLMSFDNEYYLNFSALGRYGNKSPLRTLYEPNLDINDDNRSYPGYPWIFNKQLLKADDFVVDKLRDFEIFFEKGGNKKMKLSKDRAWIFKHGTMTRNKKDNERYTTQGEKCYNCSLFKSRTGFLGFQSLRNSKLVVRTYVTFPTSIFKDVTGFEIKPRY